MAFIIIIYFIQENLKNVWPSLMNKIGMLFQNFSAWNLGRYSNFKAQTMKSLILLCSEFLRLVTLFPNQLYIILAISGACLLKNSFDKALKESALYKVHNSTFLNFELFSLVLLFFPKQVLIHYIKNSVDSII